MCALSSSEAHKPVFRDLKSTFHLAPPYPAPTAWWSRIEIAEQLNTNLELLHLYKAYTWWVGRVRLLVA